MDKPNFSGNFEIKTVVACHNVKLKQIGIRENGQKQNELSRMSFVSPKNGKTGEKLQ